MMAAAHITWLRDWHGRMMAVAVKMHDWATEYRVNRMPKARVRQRALESYRDLSINNIYEV